jgi:hypothetical protein
MAVMAIYGLYLFWYWTSGEVYGTNTSRFTPVIGCKVYGRSRIRYGVDPYLGQYTNE